MAYTAWVTKAPDEPSMEEKIRKSHAEYEAKLTLACGKKIPDPLQLVSGWQGEHEAMRLWPSITYPDILFYFNTKRGVDPKETLNKYKEGKAFSYYSSDYVKEVMFNKLDDDYVLMKTIVFRSMDLNEDPWKVWVVISIKEAADKIKRAYCTCTAGYCFRKVKVVIAC